MKNNTLQENTYLVLLVDRKKARMFTMHHGVIGDQEEIFNGLVPQKVKHGDNAWDAQDKIFRHIEDHLHRHLNRIAAATDAFVKNKNIEFILLGGHKTLFAKVKKHLPAHLQKKILGTFVSELNIPLPTIARHSKEVVEQLQQKEILKRLEARLAS